MNRDRTEEINRMTEGSISGKMIRFAIPLFIGNLFQQLYNTADALIVGRMLGSNALAAVAATGNLVFLLVSIFAGIATGAAVAISRYYGARDVVRMRLAIHTQISLDLTVGVVLTVVGVLWTPTFLRWMGTPEDILGLSSQYLRIYYAGFMGMIMYNSCRAIMQAVGDSRHPLVYLIVSSLSNIVLDYVFIKFFHGGVGSAALATIISQFISAVLCAGRLLTTKEDYRVRIRELRYNFPLLKQIVSYGLPAGLQNSVTAIANVIVQANINSFGTMAVAGCGAYMKLEGFAFLPITSFAIALTTFVGQNLGAKEYDRAKKGARFGVVCCMIVAQVIGAFCYIFAPQLIGAFTDDPAALAFGVDKIHITTLFYFVLSVSHTLAAVLRGAGKAVIPMISMLLCWCVFRVIVLSIFVPIYRDINIVYWIYPISWCMCSAFLAVYFLKADWLHGFDKAPAVAQES